MNAPVAAALPARQSRFNRFTTRWLASPLGFLSGRVVLVRYTGRVFRPASTAAGECGDVRGRLPDPRRISRAETLVAATSSSLGPSSWFAAGASVIGTAVAVAGTTGRGQRIATDYFTVHHGQAKRAGLPRMHKGEQPTPEALQAAASPLVFVVVTPRASS